MYACLHISVSSEGRDLSGAILDIAYRFSPWVETGAGWMSQQQQAAFDTAVFSIDGLNLLYGSPASIGQAIYRSAVEAGVEAYVAIAANPDVAILAAHHFPEFTVIPPGEEAAFLGLLPLEALPLDAALSEVLDAWGVRTLRDLVRLPEDGLQERLGTEAVYWQRMAAGKAQRPLRPRLDPTAYERRLEWEHPVELREPLLFVISQFMHELCAELDRATLAGGALHCQMATETGEYTRRIEPPFPTRDPKFLMKLVQHDLEAHPPAAAVLGVALAITPARSRKIQHGLFAAPAPEPERLSLTLDKIRAMVGAANVGAPELLDTWRREAWELRELDYQPSVPFSAPQAKETGAPVPVAFRYFRPPRPARVELAGGMPRRVIAQGISGRVVRATGPWRSSGEWWRATLWDRDEWDVLLAPAADRTAVYRLFQDRKSKGWFVEGEYD